MSATAYDDMVVLPDTTEIDSEVKPALVPAPQRLVAAYESPSKLRLFAPLVMVLLVETLLSLRRGGTALAIESAALSSHHPMLSPVTSRLMGDPVVYPQLARALASLGGLSLLRASSLVLILATTLLVFSLARRLFGDLAGVLAGTVFGLSAPELALGHLGVSDPLALVLLTGGTRVALSSRLLPFPGRAYVTRSTTMRPVGDGARNRPVLVFGGGALCGAAAISSFATTAVLPVAVLLVLFGLREHGEKIGPPLRTRAVLALAFTAGLVATICSFAATDSLLPHALRTPFALPTSGELPFATVSTRLLESLAPEMVLASVAAVILARSCPRRDNLLLAGALFVSLPLVVGYQLASHTSWSLLQNEAYAMVFLALLIGVGLAKIVRRCGTRSVAPVLAVLAVVLAYSAASFLPDLTWSASANGVEPAPVAGIAMQAEHSVAR